MITDKNDKTVIWNQLAYLTNGHTDSRDEPIVEIAFD
jgi:hypothetical protein